MRDVAWTFQPRSDRDPAWPKGVEKRHIRVAFDSMGDIEVVLRLAVHQTRWEHRELPEMPHALVEAIHEEPPVYFRGDLDGETGPYGHLPSWVRPVALAYLCGGFPEDIGDQVASMIYWEVFQPWHAPWVERLFPAYWHGLELHRALFENRPLPVGDIAKWTRCLVCKGTGETPLGD